MSDSHIGEKYGRLHIIGEEKANGRTLQKCLCECGKIRYVPYFKLKSGHTKSCGCLKNKYHIKNRRIYVAWWNMKSRCDSSKRKDSKYYHDKGILYCEEWKDYHAFQDWALENGYSDDLTLDRINGNLEYCPENCRWISLEDQQRNRSNCIYFTHNGETKTLAEWSRIFGINRSTLHDRIYLLGYSFEEAISKQMGYQKSNVFVEYEGKKYTLAEFSRFLKCTIQWVWKMNKDGLTGEEMFEKTEKLRRNYSASN